MVEQGAAGILVFTGAQQILSLVLVEVVEMRGPGVELVAQGDYMALMVAARVLLLGGAGANHPVVREELETLETGELGLRIKAAPTLLITGLWEAAVAADISAEGLRHVEMR
ncbi:hypothetical protein [Nibricoccus sp. IMCC34717]|uniref:hypothetical protein n=1 Tax=Nibricoccus sp. IMCC34717 TaxID=3034021 RepID=UPI00384FB0E3